MAARLRALTTLLALAPALLLAAPPPGTRLSFVSCPVMRDTRSVPCWLSENDGELYYLTIQSDVSAEVQPPMLGHQVLVEGIVTADPRICGGIVLTQTRLSVMPERDADCNTVLPVDERYIVNFNPRPPGPSSGRLAFDPAPGAAAPRPAPPSGRQSIDMHFDFERGVSFRHPAVLVSLLETARVIGARQIEITGMRGAHRLSDGSLLRESESMGQRRAEEIAHLLEGAGLPKPSKVSWSDGESEADGVDDWRSRRVTVVLTP